MQAPLLAGLAHLFVFDRHGERICPAPDRLPGLEDRDLPGHGRAARARARLAAENYRR